nr:hypothetical protein [Tanacetum cinerariifolium]
ARNYEILHERDDDDAERPDKRQKSGDWHQPTSQQSSHRNYGHNNDCHGSDRRSGGIPVMDMTKETGVSSPTDLSILSHEEKDYSFRQDSLEEPSRVGSHLGNQESIRTSYPHFFP